MKDNWEEIERLKQQLEQVKQQDRILEEIEKRLYKNDMPVHHTNLKQF